MPSKRPLLLLHAATAHLQAYATAPCRRRPPAGLCCYSWAIATASAAAPCSRRATTASAAAPSSRRALRRVSAAGGATVELVRRVVTSTTPGRCDACAGRRSWWLSAAASWWLLSAEERGRPGRGVAGLGEEKAAG